MAGTITGSTVCSMCGDVGFPDKLFRCVRCRDRFQHSYCTNYYGDGAPAEADVGTCDWCLSDVVGNTRPSSARQQAAGNEELLSTTGFGKGKAVSSGDRESGRGGTKAAGRRYKMLKDVVC